MKWLSRDLWRELQTPPARHWRHAHSETRRGDQKALVLAFALAALALISGVILSVIVVYRATDRLARVRENDIFDLLAVTPDGSLGASWAIFTASLHTGLTLRTLNRMRWTAFCTVLAVGFATLLPLFASAQESGIDLTLTEGWSWLLFYIFLLPMMVFDHIYAVISGGLLSVLLPDYVRGEARIAAIFAGVSLHLSGYMIAALTGALILPVIYESLGLSGWLADLSRPPLALVVFVLFHEAVALLLYRAAQVRLNGPDISRGLLPDPSQPIQY